MAPLAQEQADPAGRGMDQDRVARHHLVGLPQQVLGGQALEHHHGADLVGDRFGQVDEEAGGDVALLRIGAERRPVGDPVPHGEFRDFGSHRDDVARGLVAEDEGQRVRVDALALIDVDEVEADGTLPDPDLAGGGRGEVEVLDRQDLRSAELVNPNRPGHGSLRCCAPS